MGEKPTKEDIRMALQESGYLMELEVAAEFESAGFVVRTNWPFEDQDEGKSREIDVHAFQLCTGGGGAPHITVVVLCECKNNRNPYVILTRPKADADMGYTPMEFAFPRTEFEKKVEEGTYTRVSTFRELGLDKMHYALSERAKGVQFCKITRDGNTWRADHAGLFGGLFLSLAKAVHSLRRTYAEYANTVGLFFPIVVLSGELYSLDCSTQDQSLVSADRVTFYRQLDSETVKGHFMCDFVQKAALSEFLRSEMLPFTRQAVAQIQSNRELAFRR